MKILLVDDNRPRVEALVAFLQARAGCNGGEVDVASNGLAAREALRRSTYDLMILDVMLPFRLEGEPDERAAVDLLTELYDTKNLLRPGHIIGITAYDAAERSVSANFSSRSWVLVRQNAMNDDWMQTIANAVSYLPGKNSEESRKHEVDLVVITALQLELEAIRKLPWNWSPDEALDDSQFILKGTFQSGGQSRSVVAAVASRMGMVSASVLASKLIRRFRPRIVAMPGICAGVRDRTQLGDIIFADTSWDYQSGKHVTAEHARSGFQMDPHFIPADESVSARVDQLSRDSAFSVRVWHAWEPRQPSPPRLLRGPVASGSAVLADAAVTARIQVQQRKLLAVEMELYGLFLAAEQSARPKPLVLGLKSVCDFADDEKNDAVQSYAAYTSATFLRALCERFYGDLRMTLSFCDNK